MAQYRQSGTTDRFIGLRNNNNNQDLHSAAINGDQVSIGIRGAQQQQHPLLKPSRFRRSKPRRISIGAVVVFLAVTLLLSLVAFFYVHNHHHKEVSRYNGQDDDSDTKSDFLTNVTRMEKVLEFGKGSVAHGGDSRYWDRDDRRRDEDYNEDISEHSSGHSKEESVTKNPAQVKKYVEKLAVKDSHRDLYNEAGRDELKMYEAEYEASLKHVGQLSRLHGKDNQLSDPAELNVQHEAVDSEDEYDDGIDSEDARMEDYDTEKHDFKEAGSHDVDRIVFSENLDARSKDRGLAKDNVDASNDSSEEEQSLDDQISDKNPRRSNFEKRPGSKKKPKRRKFSGCAMKLLNSTAGIVEPIESPKFSRFAMQYTATEEKPNELEPWEPKFAGHQNLQQREDSFLAHDKKINCGFVRGPEETPSTGFDLAEDDASYMSSCHIAVISCIFGNSDRLRTPMGKTISRLSRKNVCFVMFTDEITLQTLATEGQSVDRMGFIGVWKIVVVKNLPYSDMRRVGKIPKLLSHRLFPSARYSIWLDSKLRLQLDPLLILEYFLWRKGYEYAISNHYDRHCVWEEVAQNKKLNKYNHTVIDQQFAFYKADGLTKFNSSDPKKLLPSNVPEGSFIIRAHTPMSNLFSCLWFNEVERFTPRDQLSFAYTYQKLIKMNPTKPFLLNMFKDCERRAVAKLFHHRSEEKRNILQQAAA